MACKAERRVVLRLDFRLGYFDVQVVSIVALVTLQHFEGAVHDGLRRKGHRTEGADPAPDLGPRQGGEA